MEKCWICGRTKEELKKAEVIEFDKNKLVSIDSAKYTNIPPVCNVCLELFSSYMIQLEVNFDE